MTTQEQDDAAMVRKLVAEVQTVYGTQWSNHSVFDLAMRCLRAGRSGATWQKIETAPRDGTEFLVYCDYGDGAWKIEKATWSTNQFVNSTYDPFRNDVEFATHWMPLPDPL